MTGALTSAASLVSIAKKCEKEAGVFDSEPLNSVINKLREAAQSLEPSWSRSWIGYQGCCYWGDFEAAPQRFSIEWGIRGGPPVAMDLPRHRWRERQVEEVHTEILQRAGNPNIDAVKAAARHANELFDASKRDIVTTLDALLANQPDESLREIRSEVAELKSHVTSEQIVRGLAPKQVSTRDTRALMEPAPPPPHIGFEADILEAISYGGRLKDLAGLARKAGLYLRKREEFAAPAPVPAIPASATTASSGNASGSDQPWDLYAVALFGLGMVSGMYGREGLDAISATTTRLAGAASPWVRRLSAAAAVAVLLTAGGVAVNLVASRIEREGGILRGVVRSPRVRMLFLVAVLLTAIATALGL